jgi:glycosyltransferase involved in cell wall biosynthesis
MFVHLFLRMTGTTVPTAVLNLNMLQPYRGLKRWFARTALSSVSAMVVASKHEKQVYAEHLQLPTERLRFKLLSGPYLEDHRFAQLIQESKQEYVVSPGYSGRDFNLLREVASRVPQVRFLVLAYPESVEGVRFPPNVQLRYGLPEIEFCRCIARARVCFLPIANHQTANGHIAIIQAMSLRTLLFTNPTPGTKDYLVDRENCLLFSGTDVEEHARRLTRLYESPDSYGDIIERAYTFARANFSIETDIRLIGDLLREFAAIKTPQSGETAKLS